MNPPPLAVHVQRGSQQFGPYTLAQLREYIAGRQLVATDLAWHPGRSGWEPLPAVVAPHGVAFPPPAKPDSNGLEWVIPINRSGLAIAAGYAGLFAVLVFPAPIALVLGVLALRDFRRHPEKRGRGRAWFGAIAGGAVTLLLATFLVAGLLHA